VFRDFLLLTKKYIKYKIFSPLQIDILVVLRAAGFEIVSTNQLLIRCQIFAKVVAASRLESI
jgi:hypothetical protein